MSEINAFKIMHFPDSQGHEVFVMGTVQNFCDAPKSQTQVESRNSPAELSTGCFGGDDRSYYCALI